MMIFSRCTRSSSATTTTSTRQLLAIVTIVVSCLMSTTNAFVAPHGQTLSTGTSAASLVQKQPSSWAQTSTTSSSTTSLGFNRKPSTNEYDKSLKDASLEADLKEQIRFFDPFPKQNDLPILQTQDVDDDEQVIGIWAARGLLLAVAMLWGTNFASVKYLETLCFHPPCNHPPSEAALARFGIAAVASLPVLIGKRFDIILAGLECGLWVTLGYVTQAEALRYIDSGTCAFICSLTVVVVPLFERFFGKPLKKSSIASAVVALSGVAVLEGMVDVTSLLHIEPAMADTAATTATTIVPGITEAATTTATASAAATTGWLGSLASTLGVSKGDIIALGQPIGFGFSFLRIEQYVEKFKDEKDRVLTIAAAECVAVGLCALLWVLVDFHGTIPNMEYMIEPHRLTAIAWTGIMTTLVAIYFEGVALQTASATDAAITFASEPVWAALFGAWLLKEQLGLNDYVGGAIITLACLVGAAGDFVLDKDSKTDEIEA